MGNFIVKIDDCYLEWSTIVDAPTSYAYPLEAFRKYYRWRYGESGTEQLQVRLDRADKNGISSFGFEPGDYEALFRWNRAGENETTLSRDEILRELRMEDFEVAAYDD